MRNLLWFGLLALFSSNGFAEDSYSWGNVVFEGGGFVDGIIPSHTQAGLVYARTDVGGAYRWDSVGGTWIPLMDWISEPDRGLYGTEALALDPSDSKRLYILTGTSYFSDGKTMILRSSDYGESFDSVNVTSQFTAHGNGLGRQSGEKLAVDPQNGAILFCGTRTSGLFRSADSGKTWSLVDGTTSLSGSTLTNDIGISYVLFDTTSGLASNGGTKTVYLGVGSTSGSLYVSTDGGESFAEVSDAPSLMAMRALMVDGVFYGTFSNGPGPYSQYGGSVWKYETGTSTWTNITPTNADSGWYYASGHEGYGYAFGGISVDPQNSSRFILSTIACYGGNNAWPDGQSNAGDIFFLSADAGSSWTILNPWGVSPTVDPNGNAWISGGNIHWAGTIEFDPFDNAKVWVGSGNGVFRTDDVTAEVPLWKFQSKGIEETVPMDLVSVPGGPLVTAIMDYDGATYDDILTSTAVHTNPIGSSNSLGYAALVGGFLRSGRVTDYSVDPSVTYDVLYHSSDSGYTWTATDTSTLPGSAGTLAMSADGSVFLLRPSNLHSGIGASASTFYRSADGGATWTAVDGISASGGVMVADPVNPAKFYFEDDGYNGNIYASTDSGKTFATISNLATASGASYNSGWGILRAAPGSEGDLWVCMDGEETWSTSGYSSNGLAHSTDGGETWSRITTMTGCLSIGLGKAADDADYYTLYMWGEANGDARGIYRSTDMGETWIRINDDTHQFGGPANGKFVLGDFNTYGRVYMSTAGRGLVYGNIGELVSPIQPGTSSATALSASLAQQGRRLLVHLASAQDVHLELVDLQGRTLLRTGLHTGNQSVSLESLANGIYMARALSSKQNVLASKQVVLQ